MGMNGSGGYMPPPLSKRAYMPQLCLPPQLPNGVPIRQVKGSCFDGLDRQHLLGAGTYAEVWRVKRHSTGDIFAAKILQPQRFAHETSERVCRMFEKEVMHMALCQCPGVLGLREVVAGEEGWLLLLDLAEGGTAWQNGLCKTETDAFLCFIQVAQSLLHIQQCGVVHRDLKPTNLLLTHDRRILVADFGWSELVSQCKCERLEWPGTLEINPPEVLAFNGPWTEKIDNYALGMLLMLFCSGRFLCRKKGVEVGEAAGLLLRSVQTIRSSAAPHLFRGSTEAWQLFLSLTSSSPDRRLSVPEVFKHPWIVKHVMRLPPSCWYIVWHPQVRAGFQQLRKVANAVPRPPPANAFSFPLFGAASIQRHQAQPTSQTAQLTHPSTGGLKCMHQQHAQPLPCTSAYRQSLKQQNTSRQGRELPIAPASTAQPARHVFLCKERKPNEIGVASQDVDQRQLPATRYLLRHLNPPERKLSKSDGQSVKPLYEVQSVSGCSTTESVGCFPRRLQGTVCIPEPHAPFTPLRDGTNSVSFEKLKGQTPAEVHSTKTWQQLPQPIGTTDCSPVRESKIRPQVNAQSAVPLTKDRNEGDHVEAPNLKKRLQFDSFSFQRARVAVPSALHRDLSSAAENSPGRLPALTVETQKLQSLSSGRRILPESDGETRGGRAAKTGDGDAEASASSGVLTPEECLQTPSQNQITQPLVSELPSSQQNPQDGDTGRVDSEETTSLQGREQDNLCCQLHFATATFLAPHSIAEEKTCESIHTGTVQSSGVECIFSKDGETVFKRPTSRDVHCVLPLDHDLTCSAHALVTPSVSEQVCSSGLSSGAHKPPGGRGGSRDFPTSSAEASQTANSNHAQVSFHAKNVRDAGYCNIFMKAAASAKGFQDSAFSRAAKPDTKDQVSRFPAADAFSCENCEASHQFVRSQSKEEALCRGSLPTESSASRSELSVDTALSCALPQETPRRLQGRRETSELSERLYWQEQRLDILQRQLMLQREQQELDRQREEIEVKQRQSRMKQEELDRRKLDLERKIEMCGQATQQKTAKHSAGEKDAGPVCRKDVSANRGEPVALSVCEEVRTASVEAKSLRVPLLPLHRVCAQSLADFNVFNSARETPGPRARPPWKRQNPARSRGFLTERLFVWPDSSGARLISPPNAATEDHSELRPRAKFPPPVHFGKLKKEPPFKGSPEGDKTQKQDSGAAVRGAISAVATGLESLFSNIGGKSE